MFLFDSLVESKEALVPLNLIHAWRLGRTYVISATRVDHAHGRQRSGLETDGLANLCKLHQVLALRRSYRPDRLDLPMFHVSNVSRRFYLYRKTLCVLTSQRQSEQTPETRNIRTMTARTPVAT